MKKFASLLLTVVLLATMLTVFAVPASAEAQTIPGSNLTWELTENDTELPDGDTGLTLTIGGEGDMPFFMSRNETPWYDVAGKITAIEINSGVTSIGNNAFSRCTSLKELTIPGSVKRIGDDAFANCSGIAALTISEGVTSIGMHAFYGCGSFQKATIPASVTSIGTDAFASCNPNLVIHGTSGTAAAQYAKEHGIDFFDNGECKHFARFTCDTCNTHLTKSELLQIWNSNGATGSILSGGSLTIIVGVAAAVVFGLGGFFIGTKKKKPATAGGASKDGE